MPLPPDLTELAAAVSNWGRWGDDDQRGTLNLIDTAAVLRGVAAVRQGRAFSLAIPFDADGPQTGDIPGRENPKRTMVAVNMEYGAPDEIIVNDDKVAMGTQACTHWDGLSHAGYDQLLYGGRPAAETVTSEDGARELGIEHFGAVVTRGVLFDLARHRGVDCLDEGYAVTGDDLDALAAAAGVTVEPGDVVLLRTGKMKWLRKGDRRGFIDQAPGFSSQSVQWLRDHDVAAAATDTLAFEPLPFERDDAFIPAHQLHLRDMGMPQGQNFALDDLADDCAADGQCDFLFVATPIPTTGTAGGIVAPTAVK